MNAALEALERLKESAKRSQRTHEGWLRQLRERPDYNVDLPGAESLFQQGVDDAVLQQRTYDAIRFLMLGAVSIALTETAPVCWKATNVACNHTFTSEDTSLVECIVAAGEHACR